MSYNKHKLLSQGFLIIALLSLGNYVLAHLAYLNMNTQTGVIYEYITLYVSKILSFLIPVAASVLTLSVYAFDGLLATVPFTLALSAARLPYYLPFYYIVFIYNHRYDSLESILLSLLASIGVILFTALFALATVYLASLIARKQSSGAQDFSFADYIRDSLSCEQELLSFTTGTNLAILIASLLSLFCAIIPETIDTVTFFVEYGLDYTVAEILTIMANYLLLFILTVGSYLLGALARNKFSAISRKSE